MQLVIPLPHFIPFYFCVLSVLHMKKLPKVTTSHPQFLNFNIPVRLATATTTTVLLIHVDVFRKLFRCINLGLLNLEFQAKHLELLVENGDALIHEVTMFLLLLSPSDLFLFLSSPPDLLISLSSLILLLFLSPPALLLLLSPPVLFLPPPALFSFSPGILLFLFFPPDLIFFLFPPELDLQLFLKFPFLSLLLLHPEDHLAVIDHLLVYATFDTLQINAKTGILKKKSIFIKLL